MLVLAVGTVCALVVPVVGVVLRLVGGTVVGGTVVGGSLGTGAVVTGAVVTGAVVTGIVVTGWEVPVIRALLVVRGATTDVVVVVRLLVAVVVGVGAIVVDGEVVVVVAVVCDVVVVLAWVPPVWSRLVRWPSLGLVPVWRTGVVGEELVVVVGVDCGLGGEVVTVLLVEPAELSGVGVLSLVFRTETGSVVVVVPSGTDEDGLGVVTVGPGVPGEVPLVGAVITV